MREVHRSQFQLGQVPVEKVWINPKSRDDIPAVLKGLQHIWCDEALRARLFVLLDEHILPEADRTVGRPGMDLWQILVLGVLKQGLGCDFDRLHDLTNHHQTIRAFLGHGDFDDKTRYEYQTVVDNVSLLTPELLSAVGRLVVESGHKVAKKKLGEPLRGRCDSFVVETDVHYPTDVSLLWDAVRCLLRDGAHGCNTRCAAGVSGARPGRSRNCSTRCARRGERSGTGAGGGVCGALWALVERARQRSTCCGARAWGNCAVAPSQASSLTPGGRLTMWSGVFCVARRFLTRRRSFPFSRNTRVGFPRQGGHAGRTRGSCRHYRRPVWIHPSPQGPVGG